MASVSRWALRSRRAHRSAADRGRAAGRRRARAAGAALAAAAGPQPQPRRSNPATPAQPSRARHAPCRTARPLDTTARPSQNGPAAQRLGDPEASFPTSSRSRSRRHGPKRPTLVEAASSTSGAGRVQVEPPATRQRAARAQPGRAADPALAGQHRLLRAGRRHHGRDRAPARRARTPNLLSPMAIKLVRLSSNLRPEFARTLETRLIARLTQRDQRQDRDVPGVHRRALARRGRELGPDAGRGQRGRPAPHRRQDRRQDVHGGRLHATAPTSNVVWMSAVVYRASDGGVVWSDAYRSDATMAALLRTGQRIPTRAERAAELERKISQRPYYGYAVVARRRADRLRGRDRRHRRARTIVTAVSREVRREPDQPVRHDRGHLHDRPAQARTSSRRR